MASSPPQSELVLEGVDGNPVLITVCAQCERMRTILFLDRERWYCKDCRAEGSAKPDLYPIS